MTTAAGAGSGAVSSGAVANADSHPSQPRYMIPAFQALQLMLWRLAKSAASSLLTAASPGAGCRDPARLGVAFSLRDRSSSCSNENSSRYICRVSRENTDCC